MTKADLVAQVQLLADDAVVAVAGYGRLAAVTHAVTSAGERVVVLYVEDTSDAGAARSAEGDPPSVAPQADCAGPVSSVREASAEGTRRSMAMQAELFGEAR